MTLPPIRLDPDSVVFPHTYMATSTRMTIKIINDSNHVVRYEWRRNPDLLSDLNELAKLDLGNPEHRKDHEKKLQFNSDSFFIEPLFSEIWPHRFQQIVITFKPNTDGIFFETAYLFDKLSKFRVPLQLQGLSLPAEAAFNIETIHIGHVNLGDVNDYQIMLMNTGQVNANFEYIEEHHDNYFDFMPNSGSLEVGGSIPIIIHFEAKHVGQFSESFYFSVNGKTEGCPKITLTGKVVGPSFVLSTHCIDFEKAGYGFVHSQSFTVTNSSQIPLNYKMHLKIDGSFEKHELSVLPDEGVIAPNEITKFTVELLPKSVKNYNAILEFLPTDLENTQEIVIKASCICPEISLLRNVLEVGDIFINKRIMAQLIALNKTEYPARYEFVSCNDPSILEAKIEYDNDTGVIQANGRTIIPVYITPKMIGQIRLTRFIRISGATYRPLDFSIQANCIGPKIIMTPEKVDFGRSTVLVETVKNVVITNNSPIPAPFKASLKKSADIFKIDISEGIIEPNSYLEYPIRAVFNDSVSFNSCIDFVFQNLAPFSLPISGKGIGCPIVPSISLGSISTGIIFTNEPRYIDFTLTNKGRRNIEIKWLMQKAKSFPGSGRFPSVSISPESAYFRVDEVQSFRITVVSSFATQYTCNCSCMAIVGKKSFEVFSPFISGTFIDPLITFSKPRMDFKHYHDTINESKSALEPSPDLLPDITQSNTIINSTELEVTLYVTNLDYFDISPNVFNLKPGEQADFDVTFLTSKKKDFLAQKIDDNIRFQIEGNPSIIYLPVSAIYAFPNLQFNSLAPLNFGVLSSETELTKDITVKNASLVDCHYVWELTNRHNDLFINQVFDIYPFSGVIPAGSNETFHISFYGKLREGKLSSSYETIAICHATGGPDYTIQLCGEVAKVDYQIEPKVIDFGTRYFDEYLISNIKITNSSLIPLQYKIQIPQQTSFNYINIDSLSGSVDKEMTATIKVKIYPGIPRKYNESINITIGRYDVTPVEIKCDCQFPQLQSDMDRDTDDPLMDTFIHRPRRTTAIPSPAHLSSIERDLFIDMLEAKKASKKMTGRKKLQTQNQEAYVSSIFVVDFGDILVGEDKFIEKTFTTFTPLPVSFEIIDDSLEGTGFSISEVSFKNVLPNTNIPIRFSFETEKRTNKIGGNIELPIYVAFSETFCYIIRIIATISIPCLSFSRAYFMFEPTIIGQKRTMTLQIQNTNRIDAKFGIKWKMIENKKIPKNVFKIEPSEGIIPSLSYENITITFEPKASRQYSLEIPFETQYNDDVTFVALKGLGFSLKIQFEPEKINFRPRLPYSDPQTINFKIINPTDHVVEVFNTQYDAKIAQVNIPQMITGSSKTLFDSMNDVSASEVSGSKKSLSSAEASLSRKSLVSVTEEKIIPKNLSICIIVHGSPKAGKTHISKLLSRHLNLPIIKLSSIWENTDNREALLREIISMPEFSKGFIIDGLDGIPDGKESELFVTHSMKIKNVMEDMQKNPFMDIQKSGETTSSIECLNTVLDSLSCHYVFLIGVTCSVDIAIKRIEEENMKDFEQKAEKLRQEMEKIALMDEEEYNALPEREKILVDQMRKKAREDIVGVEEKAVECARKSRLANRSQLIKTNQSADKSTEKPLTTSINNKNVKKKPTINEEIQAKINLFLLSFGALARIVQEKRPNTIVIDPQTLQLPNKVKFDDHQEKTCSTQKNLNSLFLTITDPEDNVYNTLSSFFPRWNVMREKIFQKLIPESQVIVPDETLYTPLSLEPILDCFHLLAADEHQVEEPERSPSSISKGRKFRTSSTIIKSPNRPKIILEQNLEPVYTPRWSIEPNSSVSLAVRFISKGIGNYNDFLNFQIVGGNGKSIQLPVTASCVIPEIDRSPTSIFKKVQKKLFMKTEYAYIETLKEYHFGFQLVMKERTKNQPPAYKTQFLIKNAGNISAEITSFLSDQGKSPFTIENGNCIIQPGYQTNITIGFHPITAERFRSTLTIYIKDNPEPLFIPIVGDGCIPSIESNLTTLDFGRVVTEHSLTLPITLKNSGKTEAYWKLKGVQQLESFLTFSSTDGIIQPMQSLDISATFSSKKSQIIKKPIQIDIMDKNKLRMYSTFHIQVLAEAFDINFDFLYPKGIDHLNFGTLQVGEKSDLVCIIKNRGKYASIFNITLQKSAMKYLKVNMLEGQITGGEKGSKQITFSFISDIPVEIKNAVVAYLKVMDTVTNTALGTVPIRLSAVTAYSKIRLDPPSLDFGLCELGEVTTKTVTVYNDGNFPFEFTLASKDIADTRNTNKNRKQKPRAQKSKSKLQTIRFYFGNFGCSHAEGTVPPGGSLQMIIEYSSMNPADDESDLIFNGTNLDPTLNGALHYTIRAKTSLPSIETDLFDQIFPDLPLCLRYDLARKDILCFVEDEQTLHFNPTNLKTSKSVKVRLINTLEIPAAIDAVVRQIKKGDSSKLPFSLSEKQFSLSPHGYDELELVFTPDKVGKYTAIFEAIPHANASRDSTSGLTFRIEAEGALPQVSVEGFPEKSKKSYSYSFGRTLVGFIREKGFTIINNGLLPANIQIITQASPDFTLIGVETSSVLLHPGRSISPKIIFSPSKTKKSTFEIQVKVEENSSSDFTMSFVGDGVVEDIIFDGLQSDDSLIFKDAVIGKKETQTFFIKNISSSDYRFQIEEIPSLTIIPTAGHIHKHNSKPITVTFNADSQVKYNGQKMTVRVQEIILPENAEEWDNSMKVEQIVMPVVPPSPIGRGISSSRTKRKFPTFQGIPSSPSKGNFQPFNFSISPSRISTSSSRSSISLQNPQVQLITKEEPLCNITQKSKDFVIKVTARSDDIHYNIDTESIAFPPTMMFEKRAEYVNISNTCLIKFGFKWFATVPEEIKTADGTPPFTIEPSEGVIEPGTSTKFAITYAPTTIGNFQSKLVCDVPSLSIHDDPTVFVSGSSRRPVCHIVCDASDYLLRRHPDYSYDIPPGTRVLEIFSKGVSISSSKIVEVMNTMETAYDAVWTQMNETYDEKSITCDQTIAIISSGKSLRTAFTYRPTKARTVESLWQLSIPSTNTYAYILVVGRIMPR